MTVRYDTIILNSTSLDRLKTLVGDANDDGYRAVGPITLAEVYFIIVMEKEEEIECQD